MGEHEKQAANADCGSEKLARCHPLSGSAKADWRSLLAWGRRVDTRKKNMKTHTIWFVLAKENGLFFLSNVYTTNIKSRIAGGGS